MSSKKDKADLTDSEKRIIQQGAIRSATRWLRFVNYVFQIDHIPTRLLKVVGRYGYGGASMDDLGFFTEDSTPARVDAAIDSLVERKKIKLVTRGGNQERYIVPENSRKAHPRINEKITL